MARSRDATATFAADHRIMAQLTRTSRSASAPGRTADFRPLRQHRGGWSRSAVDPPGADGDRRGGSGRDRGPVRLARTACPAGALVPATAAGRIRFRAQSDPTRVRRQRSWRTAILSRDAATRAPRPSRAVTSSSSGRTRTSWFHRRPTAGWCPTSSSRSRRRTPGWRRAAGPARSPAGTCRSPASCPASSSVSSRARTGRSTGTSSRSGRTCSAAAAGSAPSTTRAATSSRT